MSEGWISFSVDKKTEADEASKSKQRKRSKTTVSIGNMPITSQKKKKKTPFLNSPEICKSKWIGLPLGSPLVLIMVNAFMCHIEENWETKTRCLLSISAMSIEPLAKCPMFHLPLFSCQH